MNLSLSLALNLTLTLTLSLSLSLSLTLSLYPYPGTLVIQDEKQTIFVHPGTLDRLGISRMSLLIHAKITLYNDVFKLYAVSNGSL